MSALFSILKATAFVLNDRWSLTVAENTRQSLLAVAHREFDLGGSLTEGVDGTGAQDAADYKPVTLPGADLQGFIVQARVRIYTDIAGTTVTPRIRDITSSSDHVSGSASTSTTPVDQVLTMTLPSATREYRLQLVKSNANALVYGIGKIEILRP